VRWPLGALVPAVRAPTLQPNQPGLLQAHTNCVKLWKELAASKQRKQAHVRHRHPHLGSDLGDHWARLFLLQDAPHLASALR